MAMIDHTRIYFKNGKYLPEEQTFTYDAEDNYRNLLPFECTRDGAIFRLVDQFGNMGSIYEGIKWYRDEYDAIYERDGWRNWSSIRKTPIGIWWWLKYKFHFMRKIGYRKEVGVWTYGDEELYIYHNSLKQNYVSFYIKGEDTYVVIGGYGHRENVYCHFMGRGYGYSFEEEMASEAYRWACDDILVDIAESICDGDWEVEEDLVNRLRDRFGYESPYKIVDREEEE